jgi:hypothetical protein
VATSFSIRTTPATLLLPTTSGLARRWLSLSKSGCAVLSATDGNFCHIEWARGSAPAGALPRCDRNNSWGTAALAHFASVRLAAAIRGGPSPTSPRLRGGGLLAHLHEDDWNFRPVTADEDEPEHLARRRMAAARVLTINGGVTPRHCPSSLQVLKKC